VTGHDAYDEPGWEDAVREIVQAHQNVEGAVLPVLEEVQARFGYVSEGALELVADGLRLTPPQVYAVATYYHELRLGPQAANRVTLCRGSACRAAGYGAIRRRFEEVLGAEVGQATADGQLVLETSGCLGICPHAPAVKVNHELVGRVTPEEVAGLLEGYGPNPPTPFSTGEGGADPHPRPLFPCRGPAARFAGEGCRRRGEGSDEGPSGARR